MSELRDRLRAGDVWVAGSRQYRSFKERLISAETLQELQQAGGSVQKLVGSRGDCDSCIWTADGFEPLTEAGTKCPV
ncbi:MAG TPA: hypothetical protein VMB73_23575, partial [Acetobacteraceae bacterium]|nr:hypothetical protein [Acetobacteraceae bacterium]